MRFAAPVRFQQQQGTKLGIFADITKVNSHKKDDGDNSSEMPPSHYIILLSYRKDLYFLPYDFIR